MPAGQIEAKSLDAELRQAIYRPWDAMPCMEGISNARIEFGCEADQTGCIGCNQLENTRKPGGRFEQAGWWRVCGRIAKRLQQKPDIAVAGVPTANTSQSRRPAPFYTPVDLQRPTPLPPVHSLFGVLVAESETEAATTFY
jgi:hypothetical protein